MHWYDLLQCCVSAVNMAHNSSGEDSVRAEAGNNSIDDHTIFNTPVPMVASTVSRHLAHGWVLNTHTGYLIIISSVH